MINTVPKWLQIAIDFLNKEFPQDESVNVCYLYGFDALPSADGKHIADAKYIKPVHLIYLVDCTNLIEVHGYNGENTPEDITILNLFHEYRHHQQNIYDDKWCDEEDAEEFAMATWRKYLLYEEKLKNKNKNNDKKKNRKKNKKK